MRMNRRGRTCGFAIGWGRAGPCPLCKVFHSDQVVAAHPNRACALLIEVGIAPLFIEHQKTIRDGVKNLRHLFRASRESLPRDVRIGDVLARDQHTFGPSRVIEGWAVTIRPIHVLQDAVPFHGHEPVLDKIGRPRPITAWTGGETKSRPSSSILW